MKRDTHTHITNPAEWAGIARSQTSKRTSGDSEIEQLQCCRRLPGSQAPYLMCWRAFRPENVDDRDVESMSSAGNNNIEAQIEMPPAHTHHCCSPRTKFRAGGSCACQGVRYECICCCYCCRGEEKLKSVEKRAQCRAAFFHVQAEVGSREE